MSILLMTMKSLPVPKRKVRETASSLCGNTPWLLSLFLSISPPSSLLSLPSLSLFLSPSSLSFLSLPSLSSGVQDDTLAVTSPTLTYARSVSAPPMTVEISTRWVSCNKRTQMPRLTSSLLLSGDKGAVPLTAERRYWTSLPATTSLTCLTRSSSSLALNQRRR